MLNLLFLLCDSMSCFNITCCSSSSQSDRSLWEGMQEKAEEKKKGQFSSGGDGVFFLLINSLILFSCCGDVCFMVLSVVNQTQSFDHLFPSLPLPQATPASCGQRIKSIEPD